MLSLQFKIVELHKRYPLAISRGTTATSNNLFVFASDGTNVGVGELSPAEGKGWTAERGQSQLSKLFPAGVTPGFGEKVYELMFEAQVDPPAIAALDIALWDLYGKQQGLPLYKLWRLEPKSVPTSVTIGLNLPDITRERVPEILSRTGARALKIKLGSPEGRDFDKEHFLAAYEAAKPFHVALRVDANGGWTVNEANQMIPWLAAHGVEYVEQPLAEGQEADLPHIFANRKLPIFVDETIKFAGDVAKVAECVDGVNLKLMKCGGPTEAFRIVKAARAHGLKTMIGCMSESSIAIAAGAHIGALFDYIDLDSHLNLAPDPAQGAPIIDGIITVSNNPGHGASLI